MSTKKKSDGAPETPADDLLLRALRQLADEALDEAIPERLLRPLRDARARDGAAAPEPPDKDGAAEAPNRRRPRSSRA